MAKIDDEVKTKFMNDKHRFVTNLIYTSHWIQNGFSDFLRPYDLSTQQFNILRILRGAKDWVSMNKIKELMIDKSPHTTRLVTKLMEKELIERKRSAKDRRVVFINITDKGLSLLKELDEAEGGKHMSFMDRLDEVDAKKMSDILDAMRG